MELPRNWPENVEYLTSLHYPPEFQHFNIQSTDKCINLSLNRTIPNQLVEIRPILAQNHPASGQFGLYAKVELYPGQHIGDYLGKVSTSSSESKSSEYILGFGRVNDTCLSIDAEFAGNEMRFINDYRGVKKKPNVRFEDYIDPETSERRMGIFVVGWGELATHLGMDKQGKERDKLRKESIVKIKPGTELLLSYGKGFWTHH